MGSNGRQLVDGGGGGCGGGGGRLCPIRIYVYLARKAFKVDLNTENLFPAPENCVTKYVCTIAVCRDQARAQDLIFIFIFIRVLIYTSDGSNQGRIQSRARGHGPGAQF